MTHVDDSDRADLPPSEFSNSQCVRLLQGNPGGIIHILDDQARRSHETTDFTMVEALREQWGDHPSFEPGPLEHSGSPVFTITHFNGPVTYSSAGFVECNLNAFSPDFVSLFRDAISTAFNDPGSVNPFVMELFSGTGIITEARPEHAGTITAARYLVKPLGITSIPNGAQIKQGIVAKNKMQEAPVVGEDGTLYVAGALREGLDMLFKRLYVTQKWFVFCINPSGAQLPNQFDSQSVEEQVRSAGLVQIAARAVSMHEVDMTHEDFGRRYEQVLRSLGIVEGPGSVGAELMCFALNLEKADIVFEPSKVSVSQPSI